jgi:hypothetical protein
MCPTSIARLRAPPSLVRSPHLPPMGGYGNSRMRGLIMGALTLHLFRHSDLPILIAH